MITNDFDEFYRGWDEKYQEQSDDEKAWSSDPQPFIAAAVERFQEPSNVVDLGSGDGRNSIPFAATGHRVTAVDLSPTALQQLMDNFHEHGFAQPTAVRANIEDLPLASNQFDLAIVADTLPQVRHVRRATEEVHRILKPGGTCLVNLFTPDDCAFGEGEEIAPCSFVYRGCLFNFYRSDDAHRLFHGLFNVLHEELVTWTDPPHRPFRPYEHQHEALVFQLQKPRG